NKIAKLVKRAGFKIPDACVEDILYLKDRRLPEDRILRLAECTWVEECGTVVIISKTSGGKTYIACETRRTSSGSAPNVQGRALSMVRLVSLSL
ncbi:MAG: ATP-binding protein, partial [Olsenella sp.]